ncbi:MAG: hypothetical protein ACO37W_14610 [Prochlorotrichaceae cyanobacterium]
MTQTNFLELAKTGEPRVIAGLLNRSLQSQGITTKATRRNNELHLLLEGENLEGHEESIVEYLDQALSRLQVPAMSIHIYARFPGQEPVVWRHDLNYQGPAVSGLPTMPSNFTLPVPETAEPEMTPDETRVQQETSFDDFDPDFDPDNDVLSSEEDAAQSFDQVDFMDETQVEDRSEDVNGAPLDSFGTANVYGAADDSNGHNWHDAEVSETLPESGEDLPQFEEDELPQKSGFPLVPLSLAAIVALLFAGAGAYYRFFLFDQSPTPITTTPTDAVLEPPPVTIPSVPPISGTVPEGTDTPSDASTPIETVDIPETDTTGTDTTIPETVNPWRDAINAAMEAAVLAQTAQTAEDWGAVAETWDQSVQLLLLVPETDPNYLTAQDKIVEYTNNLDIARARELKALGQ